MFGIGINKLGAKKKKPSSQFFTSAPTPTIIDGTASSPEQAVFTMLGLTSGSALTIAQVTVTAERDLTGVELAPFYSTTTSVPGTASVSGVIGGLSGWTGATVTAVGNVLTYTNVVNGDIVTAYSFNTSLTLA